MKYKGYALVLAEVEADNDTQAREKIADKLSDDYFSWFDPDEIVLSNETIEQMVDEGKFTRINIATANEIRIAMGLKPINDPKSETLIKKEGEKLTPYDGLQKHCLSCKSCNVCGGSKGTGYCSLNCNDVNISDIACEYYEPF